MNERKRNDGDRGPSLDYVLWAAIVFLLVAMTAYAFSAGLARL